jgi:hypothetical protein
MNRKAIVQKFERVEKDQWFEYRGRMFDWKKFFAGFEANIVKALIWKV